MGYAVYEDHTAKALGVERWAGYGVPAICDIPDCKTTINRGMDYRCETFWRDHLNEETGDQTESEEQGCGLHFCHNHLNHDQHHTNGITPKPDTPTWIHHMLNDDSWETWRTENPDKTHALTTAALAAEKENTNA